MTNFFKNDTEEGKNDPDPVNAGKKRPLLYIGLVSRDGKPYDYWIFDYLEVLMVLYLRNVIVA